MMTTAGELSVARQAADYLITNWQRAIHATDLATHCRTTIRSLNRHFQSHFGQSPMAFLKNFRLAQAVNAFATAMIRLDSSLLHAASVHNPHSIASLKTLWAAHPRNIDISPRLSRKPSYTGINEVYCKDVSIGTQ